MINIKIFTLFPEIFKDYLNTSILGKSLKKGLWNYEIININDLKINIEEEESAF